MKAKLNHEMYGEYLVLLTDSNLHKRGDIALLCDAVHKQYNSKTSKLQTFFHMSQFYEGKEARVKQIGIHPRMVNLYQLTEERLMQY